MPSSTPPPDRTLAKAPELENITLTIDKLVHGGAGLGRYDNKTFFVSGALPGEVVRVGEVRKKGKNYFAKAIEILSASPSRQTPFCEVVDRCGGCDWQHIQHKEQVHQKATIFKDCLMRLGGISLQIPIHTAFGRDRAYRHRAQLKIDGHKVGFFEDKSTSVVEFSSCPVLVDDLNMFCQNLKQSKYLSELTEPSQIKMIGGENGEVATLPVVPDLSVEKTSIRVNGFAFTVSGASFFQQNREVTCQLGEWVGREVGGILCFDLFGGSGFFSLMVHRQFQNVILIERSQELVELARETFICNGAKNIRAESMSAESFFKSSLARKTTSSTSIIVDPPRGGLSPAVRKGLMNMPLQQLIYISCDPATQARDVGELVQQGGFEIEKAALFDLYPNTHHMETVLVLKRSR